jgi:hypothetical protein
MLNITWAWRDFSILHSIQTGSAAYPASYLIGTGDFTPVAKVTGA